jgi:probable rRNA maturation factor
MIVNIFNEQKSLSICTEQVEALARAVILQENRLYDEVNVFFVETPKICQLHREFFNDPSPTDCISFPLDGCEDETFPYRILGDVFVCPATALDYASTNKLDPYEETSLYIVHGLLHLMGYEDNEEEMLVKIRQAEKRHLDHLRTLDLILKKP